MKSIEDFRAVVRAAIKQCQKEGHVYAPTDVVNGVDVLECNCCDDVLHDPIVSWFRRPQPKRIVQPTTEPA